MGMFVTCSTSEGTVCIARVYGSQACPCDHLSSERERRQLLCMVQGSLRVSLSLGRERGWRLRAEGSIAGQPAWAFGSAGCEQAGFGWSPASHPPVCFPRSKARWSVSGCGWSLCHFPRGRPQPVGKLVSYPEVPATPSPKSAFPPSEFSWREGRPDRRDTNNNGAFLLPASKWTSRATGEQP